MANREFKEDARKLEALYVRTKRLLKEGYSIVEIAEKLKVPEASVRQYKEWIDKAEENRKKHENG